MSLVELFRLAIRSLWIHKLRAFLATLGILFGVAAVISMVSINESTKRQALQQFEALGISNIRVKSTKPVQKERQAGGRQFVLKYGVLPEDVSHLCAVVPNLAGHCISRRMKKNIWYGDERSPITVLGVEPSYARLNNLRLRGGRFISDLDQEFAAQVCVLGGGASRDLFKSLNPVGSSIKIEHRHFDIVGALEDMSEGSATAEAHFGSYVFIPYNACLERYGKYNIIREPGRMEGEEVYVDELVLALSAPESVMPAATVVRHYFERTHPSQDYEIVVPLELLRQREQARRVFNLVMLVIASISLLVGGIGIMNIMLANVAERTKEIGTRRALGARKRDILQQFLIESVTLTLIGGFMGIFVGVGITRIMVGIIAAFLPFEFAIEPFAIIISFAIATAVGVTFGTYPAARAAALPPLNALRAE
ncbi:MAG: ABC transporter permease [Planctomycetota bacterium]|nr:ABC transporter permease [Planctomycetota bacterium]